LSMALGVVGLTSQKLNPSKPILGYSDTSTVKLDFDDAEFKEVKYWALRTMKWFRLRGFIILKSSKSHYHVVFDRRVTWERNIHIVAWVALESGNSKLQRYLVMQCIKESSTLRLTSKKEKPTPRIVYRFGRQSGEINNFLKMRSLVRQILTDNLSIANAFKEKTRRQGKTEIQECLLVRILPDFSREKKQQNRTTGKKTQIGFSKRDVNKHIGMAE
jgi:hypothetical protein